MMDAMVMVATKLIALQGTSLATSQVALHSTLLEIPQSPAHTPLWLA